MRPKLQLVCLVLLSALPFLVFWQVAGHQFLNYDDPDYVTENAMVLGGIQTAAVKEAFTSSHAGNWHPLTWVSHMLDVQMFGLEPGKHHLVNLLIHTLNGLLLFILLRQMTGAVWRSLFVAALFSVHPLHVESVAWVSERKDVLSGLFFMLTLWAYGNYVRNLCPDDPAIQASGQRSTRAAIFAWYGAGLVLFALGLMSKPMLVTVPFLLLLLDFWPLQRFSLPELRMASRRLLRPLLEKVPFFVLAAGSCLVTFIAQRKGGSVADFDVLPLEARAANAIVAYATYLLNTFWPADLAPFYPLPTIIPLGSLLLSGFVVAALSAGAVFLTRRAPYLFVGWFWFLGMLVPVIGLIQVGSQALADRYTYLPLIGVFIGIAWGATQLATTQRARVLIGPVAVLVVAVCAWLAHQQTSLWQDDLQLFTHTLRVTTNNHIAHQNIGIELAVQGNITEAERHFGEAAKIRPTFAEAHSNLGLALVLEGKLKEGIEAYRRAIALRPDLEKPHSNVARALELNGEPAEALKEYQIALQLNPNSWEANKGTGRLLLLGGDLEGAKPKLRQAQRAKPEDAEIAILIAQTLIAQGNKAEAVQELEAALSGPAAGIPIREMLGVLLAETGRLDEAVEHLRAVVAAQPSPATRFKLGLAFVMKRDWRLACEQYRAAIQLQPDFALALNDLAWLLATAPDAELRNGREAVELARKACTLSGDAEPRFWGTLDAAHAECGDFDEAIQTANKTRDLASANGQKEIVEAADARIALYKQRQPFRQQ